MNTDQQLTEAIERYLSGEMIGEELVRFEQYRKENAEIDSKIVKHKHFAGLLKQYRERLDLEDKLNAIHNEIDVHQLVEDMTVHPAWIVQLWRNHHSKISVAASVAIFAALSTMFFIGYFGNKNQPHYQEVVRRIEGVENAIKDQKNKTGQIIKEIHKQPNRILTPGNYRGSGFALSTNGYIVTNFHVVSSKFDSIYVQNANGDSYRAKLVYTEPQYDIAILKISDDSFENLPTLPYNFKRSKSDMAEDVFSMGYPEGDSPVMDRGYISSVNGNNGDSTKYRVSIPVNFGNSGSPLINSNGSVIGIISGRQPGMEGASYAIKSAYLYKAIKNVPLDSLSGKLSLNNKNTLAGLKPVQQTKKLQNYVFMIKVY